MASSRLQRTRFMLFSPNHAELSLQRLLFIVVVISSPHTLGSCCTPRPPSHGSIVVRPPSSLFCVAWIELRRTRVWLLDRRRCCKLRMLQAMLLRYWLGQYLFQFLPFFVFAEILQVSWFFRSLPFVYSSISQPVHLSTRPAVNSSIHEIIHP